MLQLCRRSVTRCRYPVQHRRRRNFSSFSYSHEAKLWVGAGGVLAIGSLVYKFFYVDPIPREINTLILCAGQLMDNGDYLKAIDAYEKALKVMKLLQSSDESTALIKFEIATCYTHLQMNGQAETILKRVVDSWEGSSRFQLQRGAAFDRLGQFAHSRQDFKEALGYYVKALDCFGSTEIIEVCVACSQGDFSKQPEHVPILLAHNLAGVLNNIGVLYAEMGNEEKAKAVQQRALAISKVLIEPYLKDENKEVRQRIEDLRASITGS